MNIQTDKMQMIFRKDYEDRTVYTMGMSKKKQDGTYVNNNALKDLRALSKADARLILVVEDDSSGIVDSPLLG